METRIELSIEINRMSLRMKHLSDDLMRAGDDYVKLHRIYERMGQARQEAQRLELKTLNLLEQISEASAH
jgi:hypothetical protein